VEIGTAVTAGERKEVKEVRNDRVGGKERMEFLTEV
jgi:hypothetical protein